MVVVPSTLSPAFLLFTGVVLNLYAQKFTNLKAIEVSSHLIPFVKFLSTAVFALLTEAFSKKASLRSQPSSIEKSKKRDQRNDKDRNSTDKDRLTQEYGKGKECKESFVYDKVCHKTDAPTPRQSKLMLCIGLIDSIAYVLFCLGFDKCGAALASVVLAAASQVFTAISSHYILRKHLTQWQMISLMFVLVGISVRLVPESVFTAGNAMNADKSIHLSQQQWQGIWAISAAGFLYAMLGIAYESLISNVENGPPPSHGRIMKETSKIGLLGSSLYQLLYTVPRRKMLIINPMTASGISGLQLVFLLFFFGSLFNLHMFAQSFVFKHHGALGVTLVNAVRGAAIAITAAALFCSGSRPEMCLTRSSGLSAGLVTLGGALWAVSSRKNTKALVHEKQS